MTNEASAAGPSSAPPPDETFWSPDFYKKTVARIEAGRKLFSQFMDMVIERANVERQYAKQLKDVMKKWDVFLEGSQEYGTLKEACRGIYVEGSRIAHIHDRLGENLEKDVVLKMKKPAMDVVSKEVQKKVENDFKAAQKAFAKAHDGVIKTRSQYHDSCKACNFAYQTAKDSEQSSDVTAANLKKLQDKANKAIEDKNSKRQAYEAALRNVEVLIPMYVSDMKKAFQKSQEVEDKKIKAMMVALADLKSVLDIASGDILKKVYKEFDKTLALAKPADDLKWWANTYGDNMPTKWPQFEECLELDAELLFSKKGK